MGPEIIYRHISFLEEHHHHLTTDTAESGRDRLQAVLRRWNELAPTVRPTFEEALVDEHHHIADDEEISIAIGRLQVEDESESESASGGESGGDNDDHDTNDHDTDGDKEDRRKLSVFESFPVATFQ